MSLSKDEAAQRLREVEATGAASARLFGYSASAPYFVLWGLVWAGGYAFSALQPELRNVGWMVGIAVGTLGSALLGRRWSGGGTALGRSILLSIVIAVFFVLVAAMVQLKPRQMDAFVPLVFAAAYLIAGIWAGARYVVCGVVVAAATVAGYYLAGDAFELWMVAVGGGTLLLTGLWMRRP
jgi:hypothetical protein